MKLICVFGSVSNKIDDEYLQKGFEFGELLAKKEYGLIYSGMEEGISGAVAKGVSNINNKPIIGIMPEFFREKRKDIIFDGCTEKIFTKTLSERKDKMIEKSDVIIAMPGGVGTFDELFDAICAKSLGLMDKPIIIYNINNYYNNLIEMLNYSVETNFGNENYKNLYKVFDDPNKIFDYIESYY